MAQLRPASHTWLHYSLSSVTPTTNYKENKLNSAALVRNQNYTERPPLVGEVSANFANGRCPIVSAMDPHGR
jgi:hypothetical protein